MVFNERCLLDNISKNFKSHVGSLNLLFYDESLKFDIKDHLRGHRIAKMNHFFSLHTTDTNTLFMNESRLAHLNIHSMCESSRHSLREIYISCNASTNYLSFTRFMQLIWPSCFDDHELSSDDNLRKYHENCQ